MPELPDVTVYVEALTRHVVGHRLVGVRLASIFLLRSVEPPLSAAHGARIVGVERLGKRIVFELQGELFLVLHLMIAGRLRWSARSPGKPDAKQAGKNALAAFDFEHGTLLLTEAGTKKRAHLHVVRGRAALAEHDPRGLEVLECDFEAFTARLALENHTLKRALTDPSILSGIGNAYSDEALHAARLSPFVRTQELTEPDARRLFDALRSTLARFTETLRAEVGAGFPDKVTAFRPDMAVHGRHNEPCPVCGAPVQRVAFTEREFNYCATCQTGGKLLKDRALSQLLKDDWPRTVEELEAKKRAARDRHEN
jgi:formamidopyrimidine-DNA glycosylase